MKLSKLFSKLLRLSAMALFLILILTFVWIVLRPGVASADPGGGLINRSTARTLSSGAAYTTTGNTSFTTLNLSSYGAVQIQAGVVVTGSQVLTIVPQFSNAPTDAAGGCASITSWFTATEYLVYASGGITPTTTVVDHSFTITGSGLAGREVPATGQCFRIKLDFSAAGQVYTPTLYVRAVNRN